MILRVGCGAGLKGRGVAFALMYRDGDGQAAVLRASCCLSDRRLGWAGRLEQSGGTLAASWDFC